MSRGFVLKLYDVPQRFRHKPGKEGILEVPREVPWVYMSYSLPKKYWKDSRIMLRDREGNHISWVSWEGLGLPCCPGFIIKSTPLLLSKVFHFGL